jgi:hypothetical protein
MPGLLKRFTNTGSALKCENWDTQFHNNFTYVGRRYTGYLKVHKIEIFFGFDFEICVISLLVMSKY